MVILKAITELTKAIAWPAVVFAIGLLFRTEIRHALGRLSHLKYRDIEASFKEELRSVEAESRLIETSLPTGPKTKMVPGPEAVEARDRLLSLAAISPRAAITEAWLEVEASVQSLAEDQGIKGQRFISAINALHAKGVIPFAVLNITTQLRDLRNRAAHAPEIALTQSEAERYLEQA